GGEVAVDPPPVGDAALAVIQVVDLAALVDGDLADAFDRHVAGVAGGGAAGGALRFAGRGGGGFSGDRARAPFSQKFSQTASRKLAGLVTSCKSRRLRGQPFS